MRINAAAAAVLGCVALSAFSAPVTDSFSVDIRLDGQRPNSGIAPPPSTGSNPKLNRALQSISHHISVICRDPTKVMNSYQMEIHDSSSVNAYYTQGKVQVTTAMISYARHANELAFVIAHELAHALVHQKTPSMSFGRSRELEADLAALQITRAAGIESDYVLDLLQRLSDDMDARMNDPSYPKFSARHQKLKSYLAGGAEARKWSCHPGDPRT